MLLIGSTIAAALTYLVAALFLRAHGVGTLRGDSTRSSERCSAAQLTRFR
jgi:hypothetical protein